MAADVRRFATSGEMLADMVARPWTAAGMSDQWQAIRPRVVRSVSARSRGRGNGNDVRPRSACTTAGALAKEGV